MTSIDSDHFAMFIKLNYEPQAEILKDEQEEADGDKKDWADEKIEDANPKETEV
ncbi:MAG TPA: hypothetical protein VFD29_07960 [Gillisia sp.]|nr:hypothetical protein [Gillisia sp.]